MFTELFAKTNYSFLEGASHPEEMVETAVALEYQALGICDRNGVYGVPRAHVAAKTYGLKIIVGAEIVIEGGYSAFLLAKNRSGYGNLCQLLTSFHVNELKALSIEALSEKAADLFLCLPAWKIEEAPLGALKNAFADRFYFTAHSFRDGNDAALIKSAEYFSHKWDTPVVATNQPLFHTRLRKPLQDVLTCIRHTCTLKTGGFRLLPNAERCFKPWPELKTLFPSHPEWLARPREIAEQCQFSLDEIVYHYPSEWLPPGETGSSYLRKIVWEGAKRRYGDTISGAARDQIEKELALISELNYADYFLTIWDIVQFAQSQNILHQGRGSAANSIICYLLEITAIDPMRMDLLFERFISRERAEPPDIDIDFEHERREEVIQYIYKRYGRDRAAITANVICFRRRSAFREVAKVFGLPAPVVEKLQLLTHRTERPKSLPQETVDELILEAPGVSPKELELFYALSTEILAFPRHLGTHVGGFVLCNDLLTRNVPVQKAAMPGRTIVQWDKNDLDSLGFVRVDILGLGILTCIRKSLECVAKVYDKPMTLATVPPEDPNVYQALCEADTIGVFQIESRAQMNMLPRLKPRHFYDLVVEISLVRPGPIQGEMVHPYLRRRMGKEKIEYAHPLLEGILKKTYGVPLFQEQIMKMAMVVAGFTPGEADELRRAMGTWRRFGGNRLTQMGEKFCQGLMAQGIKKDFADKIFKQIEGFAEYGFPESHAASFAILAYVSAYLHYYYPDAYLCGILNAQPMGFYRIHTLVHDALKHGVKMLEVDVTRSRWDNQVETKGYVRLGMREVTSFPERTGRAIEVIQTQGPFPSFFDFVTRLKAQLAPLALTKRELFCLAMANGFECFGLDRRKAIWEIQALPLQDSHMMPGEEQSVLLPEERQLEKIFLDYEGQGVSLHTHPMSFFRPFLEARQAINAQAFEKPASRFLKKGRKVVVGGLVICRQMPPSASGVLFVTLEDEWGFINLVVWRTVYERFRELLITHSFLLCEGTLQKAEDGEVYHVIVDSVSALLETGTHAHAKIPSYDFH